MQKVELGSTFCNDCMKFVLNILQIEAHDCSATCNGFVSRTLQDKLQDNLHTSCKTSCKKHYIV